ncbi:hypothetical protein [Cellulomonas gilvus]|uniref:Uncharacterized protein n=1 Tax=Cellulomonas gilvus (strain ATCC 13127 / NRRL B-14078) TaxID=593907 RepID=F8A3B4_CELGA|nr:hypothetical protein [Cellulomonas gilvus]AEI13107.1 hypothetical protein Celgi_2608 [Cellulomonas gilvus ATCC 13127]
MFTEEEFRQAFRAQVDDEVAAVVGVRTVGPALRSPQHSHRRLLAGVAAAVVLVAVAFGTAADHRRPAPAAPTLRPTSTADMSTPTPVIGIATLPADSQHQAAGGGRLGARDGCVTVDEALLVVGPSWYWDTPRSVLVDLSTGREWRLGDRLGTGGAYGLMSNGRLNGGDGLTLPASCADFDGYAWVAGDGPTGGRPVTGRQVTELAEAIGAAGRAYPAADGGVAYDAATATFTQWIVDGAPGSGSLRDAVKRAGEAAADDLHVAFAATDFSRADQEVLVEELRDAYRNDPRWPDGIALTGSYSQWAQAYLVDVGDRWDDPGVAEYFRARFDDRVALSSMEPAVSQFLGSDRAATRQPLPGREEPPGSPGR